MSDVTPHALKPVRFNAFQMNTPSHQSPGLWRHPRNDSAGYASAGYWVELAQLLETGGFDAIFLADVLGAYDVYGGKLDAALKHGVQLPLNDPLALVPLIAHATTRLGIGVTAAVTYEHPYTFARRMSTLDHLSGGRVGWNIVTGYLDSAARNLGQERQLGHDARYDSARPSCTRRARRSAGWNSRRAMPKRRLSAARRRASCSVMWTAPAPPCRPPAATRLPCACMPRRWSSSAPPKPKPRRACASTRNTSTSKPR